MTPKCPKCTEPVKIYIGNASRTLMGIGECYDAQGVYHLHDPNRTMQWYSCENGHKWAEELPLRECPGCEGK